jgi:hypothetical protein
VGGGGANMVREWERESERKESRKIRFKLKLEN